MSAIVEGMVLIGTSQESPLHGPHRVVQVIHGLDRVVLIEIPVGPRKKEGNKQPNYYVRGFFTENLSDMECWEDRTLIQETKLILNPLWLMPDDQLLARYPPKARLLEGGKTKWTKSLPQRRDEKWVLIEPLVNLPHEDRPPDLSFLDAMAAQRAIEAGARKRDVLDALHRYFAFGCIKNALLPDTRNCGAPGTSKFGKNGVRLGRKNAAANVGNLDLAGKICDEKDRENIQDGWLMYVRPGTSVHEAFLGMSATFYRTGHTLKHGMWAPNLLPAHERPTEVEFRTHGPKGMDSAAAARRIMGEGEWAKNYRPLCGSVRSGIVAIDQVASIDASPIDVNLTSCFDCLCPIGVGRGIFVRDAWLGLYFGFHVAIGGIGTDEAKMSILRAASDKAPILERYGLSDIPAEDFPSLFFLRFIADNGELRSLDGIDSCVEQLGSKFEFIRSGRADLNSVSESGHHSRHRGLDHHLEGTTRGRQHKRGEPLPISKALLSHYQYMRLLLLWMHWVNTKQPVNHLVPTEMRRQMAGKKFEPTRIVIYRWALDNGYVSGKPIDQTLLRAHLLPKFTASIKRNVLVLHRPGTDKAIELLHGARFSDAYLATSGLIREIGSGENRHVQVRADPDDLSEILLVDKRGIHVVPNISDDVIMINEGCVADLCAMNDVNKRDKVENASKRDQDASDQRAFRKETEAQAKRKKTAAKAQRGNMPAKDRKRDKVRANQAAEKAAQLDAAAARVVRTGNPQSDPPVSVPQKPTSQEQPTIPVTPTPSQNIAATLRSRLSNFHNERNVR